MAAGHASPEIARQLFPAHLHGSRGTRDETKTGRIGRRPSRHTHAHTHNRVQQAHTWNIKHRPRAPSPAPASQPAVHLLAQPASLNWVCILWAHANRGACVFFFCVFIRSSFRSGEAIQLKCYHFRLCFSFHSACVCVCHCSRTRKRGNLEKFCITCARTRARPFSDSTSSKRRAMPLPPPLDGVARPNSTAPNLPHVIFAQL